MAAYNDDGLKVKFTLPPQDDLLRLAAFIRTRCHEVRGKASEALIAAMAAGDALLLAKEHHGEHGKWERFRKEECGVSERLCQTYVQLAKGRAAIETVKAQSSAPLSIDAALKLLRQVNGATAKKPRKPVDPPIARKVEKAVQAALSLLKTAEGGERDAEALANLRAINRMLAGAGCDLHDLKFNITKPTVVHGRKAA